MGVTTLSIARLQEQLLASPPVLMADSVTERDVIAHFGPELGRSVWPELAAKLLDKTRTDALNQRIATQWNSISSRLADVFLAPARIEAVLHAVGAPVAPAEIHLDRPFYEAALLHGREIRNRYTVLDVMASTGRLAQQLPTL